MLRLGEELIDLGELRRSIGWISSGMIADIPPDDTGLETVVTRPARAVRPEAFAVRSVPTEADFADAADGAGTARLRVARRKTVRHPFARRAAAGADRPGSHGEAAAVGARRTVCRHGPGRARAISRMAASSDCRRTNQGRRSILVTHHIEEIVPGIQNTLILSQAASTRLGRTRDVITRDAIEIGL